MNPASEVDSFPNIIVVKSLTSRSKVNMTNPFGTTNNGVSLISLKFG